MDKKDRPVTDEGELSFNIKTHSDGTVSVTVRGLPENVPAAFDADLWPILEAAALAAIKEAAGQ